MLSSARTHWLRKSTVSVAQRPEPDQIVRGPSASCSNLRIVTSGPGERQRRKHRVHAAAVGQACVHHRRRLVDAAPDLRDDLVDDPAQVRLVGEPDRRLVEAALALDPDVVGTVDHDLGDRLVGQQPLERSVSEDVVGDLLAQPAAVLPRDPRLRARWVSMSPSRARAGLSGPCSASNSCGPSAPITAIWIRFLTSANSSCGASRPPALPSAGARELHGQPALLRRHPPPVAVRPAGPRPRHRTAPALRTPSPPPSACRRPDDRLRPSFTKRAMSRWLGTSTSGLRPTICTTSSA